MYPIPPNEHLVENKVCKHCQTSFPIMDKDMEFYEKISPVFGGKKYQIPTPTLCPDCRQQRRLSFRNERKLYKRKCDATGKEIVSCFAPIADFPVYNLDYWWSDTWNASDYNSDYINTISFLSQVKDLYSRVPKRALMQGTHNVNSSFSNCVGECKNAYMVFASMNVTDSYYSDRISHSYDCIDCSSNPESSICYEVIDGSSNSRCFFSQEIHECSDCRYCFQCFGCHDCFGCTNITNSSYCIYNQKYSREEYKEKLSKIHRDKNMYTTVNNIWLQAIRKSSNILSSMNVTGDMITHSSNIHISFSVKDSENIRYSLYAYGGSFDMMDTFACIKNSSRIYESAVINKESSNILFCYDCWSHCSHILYCLDCRSCSYCFGCTGLLNKSYCILNHQYTKEEYEELVPRIIEKMMEDGEWGEFFPASMSPFGYNETVAQEYYPMTRESIIPAYAGIQKTDTIDSGINPEGQKQQNKETFLHGDIFNWSDYEAPFPKVEKIIPASKLPDSIESIPDDILNWAIECEVTKKPFRIIKQELEFYRKHHLPIPRRHPDQRHLDRMKMRNPRKLFERLCDCPKCEENWRKKGVDFVEGENAGYKNPPVLSDIPLHEGVLRKRMITTYAPERPEIVYCEECYEREVVG